ncbi:MAG: hypothetical protein R3E95_02790 [Thiolinea sp.]
MPTPLRKFGHFRMPTDYDTVYRMLTGQAQFEIAGSRTSQTAFPAGPSVPAPCKPNCPVHSIPVYEQHFPVMTSTPSSGRSRLLSLLSQYWEQPSVRVVVLQAFGGTGKTALASLWRARLWRGDDQLLPAERIYCWSFQNQGMERAQTSSGTFFAHA